MAKIIAAVMRGAARVQGQEQAKQVASAQAQSNAKMSITMKPGEPGGPPMVTVKDAPADLLNGTQAQDVQKAYDTPHQQVEAKIAATQGGGQPATPQAPAATPSAPAPTAPVADDHPIEQAAKEVDNSLGYRVPRPWDSDIAEKLKSEAGIKSIALEMGDPNPDATAHQAWKQLQHGKVTPEAVQQRVANFRLQNIEKKSNALEASRAPYERQQARVEAQTGRAQAEADRQANQARLVKTQSDAEAKQANADKLEYLRSNDLAAAVDSEDKLDATVQSSTNLPWSQSDLNRAHLKYKQDVAKAFNDYTDTKKDVFALGSQPTWEDAKTAFGHPITPQQDTIGKARWQAARNYTQRQAADDEAKQENRQLRSELMIQKLQNATTEKPVAIGRGDLNLMDTTELVSSDPAKVKNYDGALEAKEGLLRKEIADHTDKLTKSSAQARAIITKPKDRKQFGDEEQLAGFKADQQAAYARVQQLTKDLQAVQAARAARKTGSTVQPATALPAAVPPVQVTRPKKISAAPPKIGDTKTFTAGPYAGKTGKWTGSAWYVPQ